MRRKSILKISLILVLSMLLILALSNKILASDPIIITDLDDAETVEEVPDSTGTSTGTGTTTGTSTGTGTTTGTSTGTGTTTGTSTGTEQIKDPGDDNTGSAKRYTNEKDDEILQTGIEDYNVGILLIICVASAIYAYKKVRDYNSL